MEHTDPYNEVDQTQTQTQTVTGHTGTVENMSTDSTDNSKDTYSKVLSNMDRELSILSTKLDYLIASDKEQLDNSKELAKRVDALENHKHWLTGGVAVTALFSGLLLYAVNSQISGIVEVRIKEVEFIEEVCREARAKRTPSAAIPPLCLL